MIAICASTLGSKKYGGALAAPAPPTDLLLLMHVSVIYRSGLRGRFRGTITLYFW